MGISIDYVAKETASNLWRNRVMALTAVLTVAVSLSLVGTALLLRQAVNRQIGQWSNNVSLQIFMNADATKAQLASVRSLINQSPQITHCTYLGPNASYKQAQQVLQGNETAIAALSPSTVPTDFRCQLKSPSLAQAMTATFNSGIPGVYLATSPSKSIHVFEKLASTFQLIFLVVAIVLLVSSLVLILNAIRMAIFARRREVGVMKLVGATNWFIRVPFMLEGFVQGLLGALVAVVVVLLANLGVSYLIHDLHVTVLGSAALPTHELITTEILVVFVGLVVGVAGSSFAVHRFLDI